MSNLSIPDFIQMLTNLVAILGFPLAIYVYYRAKRKEDLDREYGIYNALDDKYIDFLKLCLDYPELDVFDVPLKEKTMLSPRQKRIQLILYSTLISIMERSFLMYRDQSTKIKKMQWDGWVSYLNDYAIRESFQEAWHDVGEQFDSRFVEFMNVRLKSANGNSDSEN